MDILNSFNSYTQSKFGFSPRKNQIKAAKLLAYKESVVHMGTGEGKTVVAALATLMSVQAGRHVYIVTVNDYLAKRDMAAFGDLYTALGYGVTLNSHDGNKDIIHSGDVIYTSIQELLFDYVSNEFKPDGTRFELDMAILDEIDYILLDSANTRYSVAMGDGCFRQDSMLMDAVWNFTGAIHEYTAEPHKKKLALDAPAYEKLEAAFSITADSPWYTDVMYLCQTALLARYCYFNGVDYIVGADGTLCTMNIYNGRAVRNSFFEYELDYFLRKKENIHCAGMAGGLSNTMSAPILFRKFKTVVGLSGTAKQAREELCVLAGAPTKVIRASKRCRRVDKTIRFKTNDDKYRYIREFISTHHDKYAYLVICRHEREAYELYNCLGVTASLLTNEYTYDEQTLLNNAGTAGNVLVSTQLVGRGTDIVTATEYGLCVFITYKSADARINVQACGRSGRNGAKGLAITLTSDDDERGLSGADLEAQRAFGLCEDIILENAKRSLMKWAGMNGITNYVPLWLDFRNSMRGRIFHGGPDNAPEMIHKACELVGNELKVLATDILRDNAVELIK